MDAALAEIFLVHCGQARNDQQLWVRGGAARFSGGLGVADFLKRTSLVACTPDALAALGPAALALADAEGLGAHGRSVSIRLNRRS